jgi:hypothetical protein
MAEVFVFGSNLAGRHGAGSALEAVRKYGAVYGSGLGRQGNSYAIATKGVKLTVLSLGVIADFVETFKRHARSCPHDTFNVVAIGCGLAGYSPADIGPMFKDCPPNVNLPKEFIPYV